MKMNKTISTMFFALTAILLILPAVSARIVINEVMYDPSGDENSLEWIEIYNDGASQVDLSAYKIDGYDFDDNTIPANGHIVIAKKLVGANSTDTSFATDYGNKDGVWNSTDGINAVDGYFQLSNSGKTINLTNG